MLQKPLAKHQWSEGFPIYEGLQGCVCRGCGARVMTMEEAPTDEEVLQADLPLDCDEAVLTVVHEEYKSWDGEDLWEDSDVGRPPVWKDREDPPAAAGRAASCPDLQGGPSGTGFKDGLRSLEAMETKADLHETTFTSPGPPETPSEEPSGNPFEGRQGLVNVGLATTCFKDEASE